MGRFYYCSKYFFFIGMRGDKAGQRTGRAAQGSAALAPRESQARSRGSQLQQADSPGGSTQPSGRGLIAIKLESGGPGHVGCPAVSGLERMSFWKRLRTQQARDAVTRHAGQVLMCKLTGCQGV